MLDKNNHRKSSNREHGHEESYLFVDQAIEFMAIANLLMIFILTLLLL